MDNTTTKKLDQILLDVENESELREYLDQYSAEDFPKSFAEYYNSIPRVAEYAKNNLADLVKRSNLERSYCYHILNGTKKPGRDKILCLCLAAGLSFKETQRALKVSGETELYAKNRRDAVIIFAIQNCYDVKITNELLFGYGYDTLTNV